MDLLIMFVFGFVSGSFATILITAYYVLTHNKK